MDINLIGALTTPFLHNLHQNLEAADDTTTSATKSTDSGPTRKYVRDARSMERRIGKFMRKFALPENADTDKISTICQDGVLFATVEKLPPPEPKKPKTVQVQVA